MFELEPGAALEFPGSPGGTDSFSERYPIPGASGTLSGFEPSGESVHSEPAGGPMAYLTDYTWGTAADDGSHQPEADAWAEVVASAVGSGHTTGSPVLALAGAETAAPTPPQGPQRPPNEDEVAGPGLDDLADAVYSIIRDRLAIEKERSFA
jgi:hypothetical protein